MAIYKGSRYEYSTVDFIITKDKGPENPIVFYKMTTFNNISYYEHIYITGERLDQISDVYYKMPHLWWVILEANPQIENFSTIKEGTIIKVPRV